MSGQQRGEWMTMRDQFNLLHLICRTWSTSVEVFWHRDFGDRYLGINALLVLFLVPIYGLFWEGYDIEPLMWFIPAFLVMCGIGRVGMVRRRLRGEQCHSYYSGWPRIMQPTVKFSEETCKRFIEPVLTLAIGWSFCDFFKQVPLGVFFLWAGVCQFISNNLAAAHERVLAQNLFDQVTEQQQVAERFRRMRR